MSRGELNLLYASILESKCVRAVCDEGKSSMCGLKNGWNWCVRARCVRFFRESIIVIASCHGTVRNSKNNYQSFSLTWGVARKAVGG